MIGNGMLAQALRDVFEPDPTMLVLASGVSNSAEVADAAFARESAMLDGALAERTGRLIYLSSCALANPSDMDNPYLAHKRRMEERVRSESETLVLRLPQVVGRTPNPTTLTNFLRDRIMSGEHFCVWRGAIRNLIDVQHVARIAHGLVRGSLPQSGHCVIASQRSIDMPSLVNAIENVLRRRAKCTIIDRDSPLPIPPSPAEVVARSLGIDLGGDYVWRVLDKYYGADHGA
ncbi:MAG: NAD-dependent epimerase/dehydratase family protein [Pseudomarimonas sp.]